MHFKNRVREFLIEQDYYIDIYEKHIHVFQYVDIVKLQTTEVILQMDGFQLKLLGTDFRVKKLESREILICGNLERLERIV
jgi:hypothetical protein